MLGPGPSILTLDPRCDAQQLAAAMAIAPVRSTPVHTKLGALRPRFVGFSHSADSGDGFGPQRGEAPRLKGNLHVLWCVRRTASEGAPLHL